VDGFIEAYLKGKLAKESPQRSAIGGQGDDL
jgi:hypothetical protein